MTQNQNIQLSPLLTTHGERPADIESALPGSSVPLPAHLSLLAGQQLPSPHHRLLCEGGFLLWPHAQQPFLGGSVLVNPALNFISDLSEGFGGVVSIQHLISLRSWGSAKFSRNWSLRSLSLSVTTAASRCSTHARRSMKAWENSQTDS